MDRPYKVRRFNFFNWVKTLPLEVHMTQNPNVTVRSRGVMEKCSFCIQRVRKANIRTNIENRAIEDGEVVTACQQACPTGATLYGTRTELLAEAKKRMQLKPGEMYQYPIASLSNPDGHYHKTVPQYKQHIWGEKEAGGTNVMHISSVSFDKLGMPPLEERSAASIAETVQHSLYSFMALPALALAGLTYTVRKNTQDDDDGGEQ